MNSEGPYFGFNCFDFFLFLIFHLYLAALRKDAKTGPKDSQILPREKRKETLPDVKAFDQSDMRGG